jgi:phosphatidylglycerophosphatase C
MAAHSSLPVVAAFDVDGTLTTRDCVVPFLREFVGSATLVGAVVRRPGVAAGALARRDRDALKALAVGACRGRPASEVDRAGRSSVESRARQWLRPDTTDRLRWHLAEGHRVVLVSASLRPYLEPLGEHLGVSDVLCTTFEADGSGMLTGRLLGANCRGPEKADRLRAWLGDERAEIWAYGDSSGDRELLALADRPHLVRGVTITEVPV